MDPVVPADRDNLTEEAGAVCRRDEALDHRLVVVEEAGDVHVPVGHDLTPRPDDFRTTSASSISRLSNSRSGTATGSGHARRVVLLVALLLCETVIVIWQLSGHPPELI